MIGIEQIASYIPPNSENNIDTIQRLGYPLEFLDDKIGTRKVSRMIEGSDTSDMCVDSMSVLKDKCNLDIGDVDCIVVCTQNPDGNGIPQTSAILQNKLAASKNCAGFDISLGCSGYVYGISIIKSFMEANGLKTGLFFTSDPYSKIIDQQDHTTSLLFGDGATVTLMRDVHDSEMTWLPDVFRFYSDGGKASSIQNSSGKLQMNGFSILRFASTVVVEEIEMLLSTAGLAKSDVSNFLLHQGSRFIVETLTKKLGVPANRVPVMLDGHGNTVSSALPILLERRINDQDAGPLLLCGFGVGLSVASCILRPHSMARL